MIYHSKKRLSKMYLKKAKKWPDLLNTNTRQKILEEIKKKDDINYNNLEEFRIMKKEKKEKREDDKLKKLKKN